MPSSKQICPKCGSNKILKIVYGYPSDELNEASKREEVFLGGYCADINNPTAFCNECEYRWGGNSGVSLFEMQYFKAQIGGFSGPSYSVEADAIKGIIKCKSSEYGVYLPHDTKREHLTSEDWDKLIKGLISCDFEYWIDEYIDEYVLDGTQWSVKIRLASGESINKYGSNHYPGKWEQFCRVVSSFSGEKFE